jgi:hypothetical protein
MKDWERYIKQFVHYLKIESKTFSNCGIFATLSDGVLHMFKPDI